MQSALLIDIDTEEWSPRGRITTPGIQLIAALAANKVVISLTTVKDIAVGRGTITGTGISPEAIVACIAVDRVTPRATVDTVATAGPIEAVVARSSVQHGHPVTGAIGTIAELRDIQRIATVQEADGVITSQTGNLKLLDQWCATGIGPAGKKGGPLVQVETQLAILLGNEDRIVFLTTLNEQDIGDVLGIRHVTSLGGAAVTVVGIL